MKNTTVCLPLLLIALMFTGCAAFRQSVEDVDPANAPTRDAKYDQEDLLNLASMASDKIIAGSFMTKQKDTPVIVVMGIENRTSSHLDMTTLANTISTKLFDSKKVRIIDPSIRDSLLAEQGYQLNNCPSSERVKAGKQLGAQYMLTGAFGEIQKKTGRQVRVSKKQDVYYQLTVKIIDLQTSEVVLSEQMSRMRTVSKPLIGW